MMGVVPFPDSLVASALPRYLENVRKGYILGWSEEDLNTHFQTFETEEDDARIGVHEQMGRTSKGLVIFSPALVNHYLVNYATIYERCVLKTPPGYASMDDKGIGPSNFTSCFGEEFPPGAVAVKMTWDKAADMTGAPLTLPAFDTSADGIAKSLGIEAPRPDQLATDGMGLPVIKEQASPTADEIYTIKVRNSGGSVPYRLTGMHIMTKELRHWLWISLWWSNDPEEDFGADRPDDVQGVWRNYKMCVVTMYNEVDQDPAAYLTDPTKASLANALKAVHKASGDHSWCSNPFIEFGHGNARTNCIGCHQHAGSKVLNAKTFFDLCPDPENEGEPLEACKIRMQAARTQFPYYGRKKIREGHPADYLFTFHQPDDNLLGRIRKVVTSPNAAWRPPAPATNE